jgi:hypothetical protein
MVPQTKLLLSLVVGTTLALADEVNLSPVADTSLFSRFSDNNLGGLTTVPLGGINSAGEEGRVLLRFNVAGAVPANAKITNVTLRINVTKEPSGGGSDPIDVHRVLVSWNEGKQNAGNTGDVAATGESSWLARSKGTLNWKSPGGLAGTDFASAASGSFAIDNPGAYSVSGQAGMIADVAAWIADPTKNFGWMLRSHPPVATGSAKRVATREGTASVAPRLTVGFTVPPVPPQFASAKVVGNTFEIRFHANPGLLYEVQSQDALGTGEWTLVQGFSGGTLGIDAVATDLLANGRYYRLAITGAAN